jgi:hypothetical protein
MNQQNEFSVQQLELTETEETKVSVETHHPEFYYG